MSDQSPARISGNLTAATQASLQRVVDREGVTITEALRRLVAYGDLIDQALTTGAEVLRRHAGEMERLILL